MGNREDPEDWNKVNATLTFKNGELGNPQLSLFLSAFKSVMWIVSGTYYCIVCLFSYLLMYATSFVG